MSEIKYSKPTASILDNFKPTAIVLDVETYDPDLKTFGPAFRRGGFIVGVGMMCRMTGEKIYIHFLAEPCLVGDVPKFNEENVNAFRQWIHNFRGDIVGHNIIYDMNWLQHIFGQLDYKKIQFFDTANLAFLHDENLPSYSLNYLAKKYFDVEKKDYELIKTYGADYITRISEIPEKNIKEYCLWDCSLTELLYSHFDDYFKENGIFTYAEMIMIESGLLPFTAYMNYSGVRIDKERLKKLQIKLREKQSELHNEYYKLTGSAFVNSNKELTKIWSELNLPFPDKRTPKTGAYSFTGEYFNEAKKSEHSKLRHLAGIIDELNKLNSEALSFIENSFSKYLESDKIYPQFHQSRNGFSGGTITGRFTCSKPNLQQMPGAQKEFGREIRKLFLPFDDEHKLVSADYSQIEFRLLVHLAIEGGFSGAGEIGNAFKENPDIDFHQYVAEIASIDRYTAKCLNFGLMYGMGIEAFAKSLSKSQTETKEILSLYHSKFPFVKEMQRYYQREAEQKGELELFYSRKRHFNLFIPMRNDKNNAVPLSKEKALEEYGQNIKRAKTKDGLNAVLQGNAACFYKKKMRNLWKARVDGYIDIKPHITLHDELIASYPKHSEADVLFKMKKIMESAKEINIPIKVNITVGNSWGDLYTIITFEN